MLVNNFQHLVVNSKKMDGIFVCNINPFLVAATILFICDNIKEGFPLAKLRIQQFEEILVGSMIVLLNNVYDHEKIRLLLLQQDSDKFTTLAIFAHLKLYNTMQTRVADRVIQDTWISRVDVSGSFFENSTAYHYLTFGKLNG